MTNWEYREVRFSGYGSFSEAELNRMGAEGWELVGFTTMREECSCFDVYAIFKRPVVETLCEPIVRSPTTADDLNEVLRGHDNG